MLQISKKIKGYSVVKPGSEAPKTVDLTPESQSDVDRRLVLKKVGDVVKGSARWPKRPHMPDGNEAWTFRVIGPSKQDSFYLTVGHYRNGTVHPFEVFIDAEAPRAVRPLPRLLSRVMRTIDKRWLLRNLEALLKVDSNPFPLTLPGGKSIQVGGPVAALAHVVKKRCEDLGHFDDLGEDSPMMAALMAPKEPKTDAEGCTTYSWDINNDATGDHGLLTVKEAITSDGTRVPLSIWLSGFSKDWDGFCKLISLQMQVSDFSLIAATLEELQEYHELNAEYGWAPVPGKDKSSFYPSTLAYIATVLRHRYTVLGLFGDDGQPVRQIGLFSNEPLPENVVPLHGVAVPAPPVVNAGPQCPSCNATMIVQGGCPTCGECGYSKCS